MVCTIKTGCWQLASVGHGHFYSVLTAGANTA